MFKPRPSLVCILLGLASCFALDSDFTTINTNLNVRTSSYFSNLMVSSHSPKIVLKTDSSISYFDLANQGPIPKLRLFVGPKDKPSKVLEVSPTSLYTPQNTVFYEGLNVKGELVINQKRQWVLAHKEDFQSFEETKKTKCGPFSLLGGYCVGKKQEEIQIDIALKGLGQNFVRIRANISFIDN